MKNSKKGVFYAIMAILGLSGASANADIFSDMGKDIGTAARKGYGWAKAHPDETAGILTGLAVAGTGLGYYGQKKYKDYQVKQFMGPEKEAKQATMKRQYEKNVAKGKPVRWIIPGPQTKFRPAQPAPEKSWAERMMSKQN